MNMATFNVWGSIKIEMEFEVEAENEEQAKKNAIDEIKDFYHLDSVGSVPHSTRSSGNLESDRLWVDEIEDD